MKEKEKENILIIGAGPAGAATAIFLAKAGWSVTMIDRKEDFSQLKIGESLPPNAKNLLQQLGVWESFNAAEHLPAYGNKSFWGSDKVSFTDFINHPVGHGWHIHRGNFEKMLIQKAESLGVTFIKKTSIQAAEYEDTTWRVRLKTNPNPSIEQRFFFIIDASGRNSWLARRQGIERLIEDEQLALVAFLKSDKKLTDTLSLIETTAQGWWYSAGIPENRLVTAFLCTPSQALRQKWQSKTGWSQLLSTAPHTAQRVKKHGFELLTMPKFVAANSSLLENMYGQAWLAVGDAAMTYDPIAAHGIMMAMVSARDAATALFQHVTGDHKALEKYQHTMRSAFLQYVEKRAHFYQAERRFLDSSYWNKFDKKIH